MQHDHARHEPRTIGRHALGKLSGGELDDDRELREENARKHEGLGAQALAGGIGDVVVHLPDGGDTAQVTQANAQVVENAWRRHPQQVLEEEDVEVADVEHDDENVDGHEASPALSRLPPYPLPGVGRELQHHTLYFARQRGNGVDASPLVRLELQPLADLEPHEDAQGVGAREIEQPLVPPALLEVVLHVREGDLEDLPVEADHHADNRITDTDGLHHPAEEVAEEVQVKDIVFDDVPAEAAVHGVFFVGQGHSQRRVELRHELASLVLGQEEQNDEKQLVEDAQTKGKAPEQRMGARERTRGKHHHAQDKDEETTYAGSGFEVGCQGSLLIVIQIDKPGQTHAQEPEGHQSVRCVEETKRKEEDGEEEEEKEESWTKNINKKM